MRTAIRSIWRSGEPASWARRRRSVTFSVVAMVAVGALAVAALAATPVVTHNARVDGTFTMATRITVAVNVNGEHAGEVTSRTWVVSSADCRGSVCRVLHVSRERGSSTPARVTLGRIGNGRYRGTAGFYVPLRCLGRTYSHGSRADYTLTLWVIGRQRVGVRWYATALLGSYVNASRTDTTPCPLGPSHDAAVYVGRLTSALPAPPVVTGTTTTTTTTPTATTTTTTTPTATTATTATVPIGPVTVTTP